MKDFEKIYHDEIQTVYGFSLCLCRDAFLAEELTQETFYQAMVSFHRYNGECKISTWLCSITKRLWYKELRSRKKTRHIEQTAHRQAAAAPVEEDLEVKSDREDLYAAIDKMKEPIREIMYLRLTKEMSFLAIGDVFGESETWARVNFYRGKQKLMKGGLS